MKRIKFTSNSFTLSTSFDWESDLIIVQSCWLEKHLRRYVFLVSVIWQKTPAQQRITKEIENEDSPIIFLFKSKSFFMLKNKMFFKFIYKENIFGLFISNFVYLCLGGRSLSSKLLHWIFKHKLLSLSMTNIRFSLFYLANN